MSKQGILNTDIYGLTAEKYSLGRNNVEVVKELIKAGVEIIQYRAKEKNMLAKYQQCKKIRNLTQKAGVALIVNDDVDLALAVDADGVHVGQEDLPVAEVRKLLGSEKIIGLSTHNPQQAQQAVAAGVDYIGVGPIFETNTKKDVCAPVGLEYLKYVVENIDLPFVAIGGIKEKNIKQVQQTGAKCIAMVTEIVGSKNIEKKVKSLRLKLNE
ncbi:MAG: thiamine phosphate synthase [Bacillota bacterium]